MSVNPVTGIVTYTLAEWKEEREAWQSDGAIRERERIIKLIESDGSRRENWWIDKNKFIAFIKGENK